MKRWPLISVNTFDHDSKLLALVKRRGLTEVILRGLAYFSSGETLYSLGSESISQAKIWARSLLKPWQFLAILDEKETLLPWHAIGLASHQGEKEHLAALNKLTRSLGIDLKSLSCPLSRPMMTDESNVTQPASRLFHPCSGKHLWILGKSSALASNYLSSSQEQISSSLEPYFGSLTRVPKATDSCGLATWAFPVEQYFEAWGRLAAEKSWRPNQICSLMTNQPFLVGGTGRLDTEIMLLNKGLFLAKEGADGLLVVQELSPKAHQRGALFIKIEGGFDARNLRLVLYCLLKKHEHLLSPNFLSLLSYCQKYVDQTLPQDVEIVF